MSPRRYNKFIKGLCRDPNRPAINLANTTSQDASARFTSFVKAPLYDMHQDPVHTCVMSGRMRDFTPQRNIIDDLRVMNSRIIDRNSCVGYPRAKIMGVQFNAGEWPSYPRCGSVITCLKGHREPQGPRSLFARVQAFFKVIDDDNAGYALVSWFTEPEYIYSDNPLGPRCKEDGSALGRQYGNVVRLTQICPTQIMLEPETESDSYIMIRDAGWCTRRT